MTTQPPMALERLIKQYEILDRTYCSTYCHVGVHLERCLERKGLFSAAAAELAKVRKLVQILDEIGHQSWCYYFKALDASKCTCGCSLARELAAGEGEGDAQG